jgi:A/G-specific adenine glycosylase
MLQQTRVEAVIPYFNRFIETLPTIKSVAEVDDDLLNKLWEGLGYYSRVRNIKKAAIQIMQDFNGELPQTRKDLESLSGIGPYTAGAILSIAFGIPDTAVDGNVLRVFARLTANTNNIKDPKEKAKIRTLVSSLLPTKRVGDFNQGLMEIGATVCLPNGVPKCVLCPFNQMCEAFQQGLTKEIPKKQQKKERRIEKRTVLILEYDNKVVLQKRDNTGLLAGLYEFPNELGHLSKNEIVTRYPSATITTLPKSKHIFSHLEWHMIGYHIELSSPPEDQLLVTIEDIQSEYSIPTAFKDYKFVHIQKH